MAVVRVVTVPAALPVVVVAAHLTCEMAHIRPAVQTFLL